LKLLVSVVDAQEAVEALKGGADIIDVKNPEEGSLGAAPPWVIHDVIKAVAGIHDVIKAVAGLRETSCTLGDLPALPGSISLAATGAGLQGPDFIKVAAKDLASPSDAVKVLSWTVRALDKLHPTPKVIACTYADWEEASALSPLQLVDAAARSHAFGVLVDTYNKHMEPLEVKAFVQAARRHGLLCAIAGSLTVRQAPAIRFCNPDIVGIRGAACQSGDRTTGRVSSNCVRLFRQAILQQFESRPSIRLPTPGPP